MSADTRTGWQTFDSPGHFIGAPDCRWHLHTQVTGTDGREYRVSSVGAYHPAHANRMQPIGAGDSYYETLVFLLGDDGEPTSWLEIDGRRYGDAIDAKAGHMELAHKWAERTPDTTVEDDE